MLFHLSLLLFALWLLLFTLFLAWIITRLLLLQFLFQHKSRNLLFLLFKDSLSLLFFLLIVIFHTGKVLHHFRCEFRELKLKNFYLRIWRADCEVIPKYRSVLCRYWKVTSLGKNRMRIWKPNIQRRNEWMIAYKNGNRKSVINWIDKNGPKDGFGLWFV